MMNKNKSNQLLDGKKLLVIASTVVFSMGAQVAVAQSMSDRVETLEKELESLKAKQDKTNVLAVYKGNRLGFKSEDGDFSFNLNGRMLMDTAWADANTRDLGQESFFRAVRLAASGKLYRDWQYKFQYEFTASGAGGLRDAFFQYHGFQLGGADLVLSIGNQFQPFGFEGLQSSKYTRMMELSGPAGVLGAGARRLGIRADLTTDVFGWAVGLAQQVPGSTSPQDGNDELDLSTKVWFAPINSDGNLVHLGASLRHQWAQGNDANLRVRARPETRVDSFRALDTGVIGDSDGFTSANAEFVYGRGPFNMSAEYYWTQYDELTNAGANNGVEPEFTGATVEGEFYLTGEARPYSLSGGGVFGPVRPNSPLSKGGTGAWSVSARFSTLDLSDGGVDGGKMDVASVGLNWFPERRIRFSLNAGQGNVDGGPEDGSDPVFVQARTQVEW